MTIILNIKNREGLKGEILLLQLFVIMKTYKHTLRTNEVKGRLRDKTD